MTYTLTDPIRKRCTRRRIEVARIADALDHSAQIERDPDDRTLVHAVRPINCHEIAYPVAVVTAYFDDDVADL